MARHIIATACPAPRSSARIRRARPYGLLLAAGLMLVSCGGGDKDTPRAAPDSVPKTYSALYTQVLGVTTAGGCAESNCHTGENANIGGPDFRDKAALYTALTTKVMSELSWNEVPINCDTFKLVNPSNPATSLLLGTIVPTTDASGKVFDRTSCTPSTSNHVEVHNAVITGDKAKGLVEWIKAGAKND